MSRRAGKLVATLVCSFSIWAATSAPIEAGIIPWVYNAIFGPAYNGPIYAGGAAYGPSNYGPVGYAPSLGACGTGGCATGACGTTQSYYGPVAWGGWRLSCAPCQAACAPCGPACSTASAGYGVNDCVGTTPAYPLQPTPDSSSPPQTFQGQGTGTDRTPDAGFKPARERDGTETKGDDANFPAPVEKGKPAPSAAPSSGPAKKATQTPPIPETKDANVPVLNLDDKVAWRPAAERTRLPIKPHYANARLIRTPALPQTEWVPVSSGSKLAKK